MRYIFKELGWTLKDVKKVKIFGDNQASLQLTENPELHQRTKHIAVKYHYIREARSKGIVRFWYCPTKDMAADGLTKPLAWVKHQAFVTQLGLQWVEPPKVAEERHLGNADAGPILRSLRTLESRGVLDCIGGRASNALGVYRSSEEFAQCANVVVT